MFCVKRQVPILGWSTAEALGKHTFPILKGHTADGHRSHSSRGGWQQGPIMAIDVQTVVKYGTDYVYTLSVTGAELLVALENSVSKINTGRFMQVSKSKSAHYISCFII